MRTLGSGGRLVVASHNPGKVWEIEQLIAPYGLDAVSAGELELPEPEETEASFEGNARLKAVAAAAGSGLPALADDSGLEVECLDGAPGIYSARWAGPTKDFGVAMARVAEEITLRNAWQAPGPRANFISVLCLAWPDGEHAFFEGRVFGRLVWPPRGGNGFGYDPMFVPDGDTRTFGEMEPEQKYAISHRTRAFAAFKAKMLEHIAPRQAGTAPAGRDVSALAAAAASLSTKAEFATFLGRLQQDFLAHRQDWASADIGTLLATLARDLGAQKDGSEPPWRALARALVRASGDG